MLTKLKSCFIDQMHFILDFRELNFIYELHTYAPYVGRLKMLCKRNKLSKKLEWKFKQENIMRRKYSSFIPKDIPMSIFHRKRWHWKVAYNYNILCVQFIPKAMRLYAISLVFSSQMPTVYADYKPIMTFKQSRDRNPPFTYVNWGHTSIFRFLYKIFFSF